MCIDEIDIVSLHSYKKELKKIENRDSRRKKKHPYSGCQSS